MEKQLFVDGIGVMNVNNGVVRIELTSLLPKGESMEVSTCARIVTSMPGFLNILGAMNQMAAKMVDAGILTRTTEPAADAPKDAPKE